jgi:DNA-binding MarR family transcriptional regulator
VLGALALAVADRVQEVTEQVAGHGASGPAALVALDGVAAGGSIDALRRALGITHSGAVRLVDRLAAAGLVQRRTGPDSRTTALNLTPTGRRTARRIASAREAILEQALLPLSTTEREWLFSLLESIVACLTGQGDDRRRACRRCDVDGCRRGPRGCPADPNTNARLER